MSTDTRTQAAPPLPFDRRSEDVGNIVELGHLNLRVPDQSLAIQFYVSGLGLTRDPYLMTGIDNAWINVGASQFHLPIGAAQVLGGTVHLVMADLDALVERLTRLRSRLAGTRFAFERGADGVDVQCPWGNRIRVHAPDVARFGRVQLGLASIEIDVPAGSTPGIGRFYRDVLAAPVSRPEDGSIRIAIGLEQSLVFRESRETSRALRPYDGHHIQISVADFSGVHGRLLERGLVTEESSRSQYRFEHIVDPDSGEVLATLEHEVRSMRHPLYARPLVNRNLDSTTSRFAAGDESAAWRLPSAP